MTKDLQRKGVLWLWIFLFLFLSSCGWPKKEQIQRQMDHTSGQAQMEVEAGRFQRAIDICEEIHQKYPRDPTIRSGYIRTLESIKSSGDRAFEKNDFEMAGWIYQLLLKHVFPVTQLNDSFDREGLAARIEYCKKILFENGLEQYRSGNLGQAISIWKTILTFDPENQEIKRVVDMATLQLKNLQEIK
jgi:outer membrane protein assembly factor BamD (BamD/ComL family)